MNIVILTGYVGSDPDVSKSRTGQHIMRLSLATRRSAEEKPDWHRCVVYGNYAEKLAPKVKKGTPLAIKGRIKYSEAVVDGVRSFFTDIIVESAEILRRVEHTTTLDASGNVESTDGEYF